MSLRLLAPESFAERVLTVLDLRYNLAMRHGLDPANTQAVAQCLVEQYPQLGLHQVDAVVRRWICVSAEDPRLPMLPRDEQRRQLLLALANVHEMQAFTAPVASGEAVWLDGELAAQWAPAWAQLRRQIMILLRSRQVQQAAELVDGDAWFAVRKLRKAELAQSGSRVALDALLSMAGTANAVLLAAAEDAATPAQRVQFYCLAAEHGAEALRLIAANPDVVLPLRHVAVLSASAAARYLAAAADPACVLPDGPWPADMQAHALAAWQLYLASGCTDAEVGQLAFENAWEISFFGQARATWLEQARAMAEQAAERVGLRIALQWSLGSATLRPHMAVLDEALRPVIYTAFPAERKARRVSLVPVAMLALLLALVVMPLWGMASAAAVDGQAVAVDEGLNIRGGGGAPMPPNVRGGGGAPAQG